jgi:hypothetical protein
MPDDFATSPIFIVSPLETAIRTALTILDLPTLGRSSDFDSRGNRSIRGAARKEAERLILWAIVKRAGRCRLRLIIIERPPGRPKEAAARVY